MSDDLLIQYSEWLDAQGLICDPSQTDPYDERSHEELVADFLVELNA